MAFNDAFKHFPVLETERLVLNELGPEDAQAYHEQQKSALDLPGRPTWSYGFETGSPDKARLSFQYSRNAWIKKSRIKWAIRLKKERVLIGQCELFDFANQSKAEVGYWLGAASHNQGLMTEALRAIVAYSFGTMEMHRLYAHTATENAPSVAMLKKVGFLREGVLRQDGWREGVWGDTVLMAILKSDTGTQPCRLPESSKQNLGALLTP